MSKMNQWSQEIRQQDELRHSWDEYQEWLFRLGRSGSQGLAVGPSAVSPRKTSEDATPVPNARKSELYYHHSARNLATANQLKESGKNDLAERHYAVSERWLIRANILKEKGQ